MSREIPRSSRNDTGRARPPRNPGSAATTTLTGVIAGQTSCSRLSTAGFVLLWLAVSVAAAGLSTGMVVSEKDGVAVIDFCYVGSPADKAGLIPGDIITSIDSQPVAGMTVEGIEALLAGKKRAIIIEYNRPPLDVQQTVEVVPEELRKPRQLFPVPQGMTWGYIDEAGQMFLPPVFEFADCFSQGLAAVLTEDGFGYIDMTGRFKVKPGYDHAAAFSDGLGRVLSDSVYGFVDLEGRLVVEPHYDEALQFSSGMAAVAEDGKWGFIDRAGNLAISLRFRDARSPSEGLAAVRQGGSWGFIDAMANWELLPQYEWARSFRGGLACVAEHLGDDPRYGFINKDGQFKVSADYEAATGFFSEGLAAVKKDGQWGFVDQAGAVRVQFKYDAAADFSEGLAAVRTGELWGYMTKTGALAIEPCFDQADPFKDGLARVVIEDEVRYIDKKGNSVWEEWGLPEFEEP
jgi:hypothetical protein